MSKEKKNTQNEKRKLSRQERKQIDTLIRQAKGDGKPHTAQDSIPFERMYKDGICRLANGRYSKCIEFEDINYQLAQPDDKTAIFEALCDMYNSFDASISVQLSLISRHANKDDFKNSITIAPQNDDFDSIRAEYTEMLRTQLERGNNGLIKTKFLTFTVEAKDIRSARARLARIETDTLNHFKVIGAAARVLDGKQRLEVLHGIFHPDGNALTLRGNGYPQASFCQRLYRAVLFPIWRRANVSNGRQVWRSFLFADRRAGTLRPYACRLHGRGKRDYRQSAHSEYRPQRSNQDD